MVSIDQKNALLFAADHRRRRFLFWSAAVAVSAAAGASTIPLEDDRGRDRYEEALGRTWRHSDRRDLPWESAQRELVRYATLAANNHNSQPWRFRLLDRGIEVAPDFGRHGPGGDVEGHELYVSLGCAVENMVQAADAFGLRAIPSFDAGSGRIKIALAAGARRTSALFDAIPRRNSARGEFDGRPIAADQLRLLEKSGNGEGVRVLLFTESRQLDGILDHVRAATVMQMNDEQFVRELKSWIRLNYRDAISTGDGLFVKCYGHRVLVEPLGRIQLSLNLTSDVQSRACEQQIKSAAGLAIFVAELSDLKHWVEAGRCSQRFALQAAALGIRTSFISQPIVVPAVRERFAAHLGLGAQRPDVMLRFGHGPESLPSVRRPIDQVIVEA
jgi:nitroreductase